LTAHHPDTLSNDKFSLLKALLTSLKSGTLNITAYYLVEVILGKLRIRARDLQRVRYVWMDYFSIPQADSAAQLRAINSIAAYILASSYFFVLAGPWRHEDGDLRDVRAWANRGWHATAIRTEGLATAGKSTAADPHVRIAAARCRMEMFANALSTDAKPMIVAQSPTDVRTFGSNGLLAHGWLVHPVGLGNFSVAADREKLGGVIVRLITARKQAALKQGDLLTYRLLHACTRRLLQGISTSNPHMPADEPLVEWMAAMRFTSAADGMRSGYTPLRFAVMAGREDLVEQLLAIGASVEAPLRKPNIHLEFLQVRRAATKGVLYRRVETGRSE
jgi:hypothetical protein